jgi:hypothetical protein
MMPDDRGYAVLWRNVVSESMLPDRKEADRVRQSSTVPGGRAGFKIHDVEIVDTGMQPLSLVNGQ